MDHKWQVFINFISIIHKNLHMKITNKFLQILGGFCFLAGAVIGLIIRQYNVNHPEEPNSYGKWIGIAVMIIGLILLMPWVKDKEQK
jgi:uncharacterized protein YjeT (DUF2065 family)